MRHASDLEAKMNAETSKIFVHIHNQFSENPSALLSGPFMKLVSARVEEEHAHFVRDIGANVEEFKIEVRSDINELKRRMEGGS